VAITEEASARDGSPLRRAIGAHAEDGEMVDGGSKSVLGADGVAKGLDQGIVHVKHVATFLANEVMVAGAAEELEMADTAAEIGFGDQPDVAKELERAIDG